MCDWLEKLDATGNKAMFGDDDINFDMQLERFDVDTGALKEPAVEHTSLGMGRRLGGGSQKEE